MPKFLLLHGKHVTSTKEDVAKAAELSMKRNAGERVTPPDGFAWDNQVKGFSPPDKVYLSARMKGVTDDPYKGDVIEAEGDEAAMLFGNPNKYMALLADGSIPGQAGAAIEELQQENARLRAQLDALHAQGDSAQISAVQTTGTPTATATVTKVKPNLDSMNLKQLQDYAAEEEIDLKGATKREDILRILKAS